MSDIKLSIAVILIAILLYFMYRYVIPDVYYAVIHKTKTECETLIPMERPMVTSREWDLMNDKIPKLRFTTKERICLGKYGFRKEFEVTKRTNFAQEVIESSGLDKVHFGIYCDEFLKEPIKEISLDQVLEASFKSELNRPYEEVEYRVDVTLEPGIYYIGVYSTDPREQHTVSYESWQAVVESEIELEEGKWGLFLSTGDKDKTYCKMNITKPGKIYADEGYGYISYDIKLCDDNKKIIAEPILDPPGKTTRHQKAIFDIPKAGIYYLQVISGNPKPSVAPNEIRYRMGE